MQFLLDLEPEEVMLGFTLALVCRFSRYVSAKVFPHVRHCQ